MNAPNLDDEIVPLSDVAALLAYWTKIDLARAEMLARTIIAAAVKAGEIITIEPSVGNTDDY